MAAAQQQQQQIIITNDDSNLHERRVHDCTMLASEQLLIEFLNKAQEHFAKISSKMNYIEEKEAALLEQLRTDMTAQEQRGAALKEKIELAQGSIQKFMRRLPGAVVEE